MFTFMRSKTFLSGLAMFSMFFGAGNIIFPLAIGHFAQDKTFYAIIGLLLTGVLIPFTGLIAIILYDGNYHRFFKRIGSIPGFIVATLVISLLGPFGSTPRCIALAFSTMKMLIPDLSLTLFSAASCLIVFLLTIRRNKIIDILGRYLTPILLISLATIIVGGLMTPGASLPVEISNFNIFIHGLKEGYNTMDLLAAFFFSSIILANLKAAVKKEGASSQNLLMTAIKASGIGAGLLALTYIGFSFVASVHSTSLQIQGIDELLGAITLKIMGPYAGYFVCLTIAMACLTTAIALSSAFAGFLQTSICREKISYKQALFITLLTTFCISTLEFQGISAFLGPILELCYPALIGLTIVNIIECIWKKYKSTEVVLQE